MLLENLLGLASEAESDAEAYEVAAREAVRGLVAPKGKVDPNILEREQFAAHGFAWIATYVAALRQMRRWAEQGAKGELELLMLQSAFGEVVDAAVAGGVFVGGGDERLHDASSAGDRPQPVRVGVLVCLDRADVDTEPDEDEHDDCRGTEETGQECGHASIVRAADGHACDASRHPCRTRRTRRPVQGE